jgi:hypothetical protein
VIQELKGLRELTVPLVLKVILVLKVPLVLTALPVFRVRTPPLTMVPPP